MDRADGGYSTRFFREKQPRIFVVSMRKTVSHTQPQPPRRIVSVVPSQTELLFDLGLDEEVVGVTKFCIHPAGKVKNRVIVGGTKTLHLDRIQALKPDFILANKEENTREQIEQLQRLYPVLTTDINSVAKALTMIRNVGAVVGRKPEADRLAGAIETAFRTYGFDPNPTKILEKPAGSSVAYFIWRKPYRVAGCQTFIHSMLETAGFQNAFGGSARYPEVTEAELETARSELIFLSSEPYPFAEKHRIDLQKICPSAQIRLVDGEVFSWYGSRMVNAAAYIRKLKLDLGLQ